MKSKVKTYHLQDRNKRAVRKKQDILKGIEESVRFIKLHQQGKVKAKSIQDLLNEL